MDRIWIENFRCFRDRQEARLVPLTFLVGENSTGKTSFLAMIRALWDIAYLSRVPDFKEPPYDLGSFDEIAHHRGAKGGRANAFEAGFNFNPRLTKSPEIRFEFTFGESRNTPIPIRRRLSGANAWLDETFEVCQSYILQVGTHRGAWEVKIEDEPSISHMAADDVVLPPYYFLLTTELRNGQSEKEKFVPLKDAPSFGSEDIEQLETLVRYARRIRRRRPFASAAVRSKPRRTYDPSRPAPDPEGDYVPMYLADLFSRNKQEWGNIKKNLKNSEKHRTYSMKSPSNRLAKKGVNPFKYRLGSPIVS